MKAPNRKTPAGTGALDSTNSSYSTTIRGRRALTRLWAASRAVHGAALTPDDKALIMEALTEIAGVLK